MQAANQSIVLINAHIDQVAYGLVLVLDVLNAWGCLGTVQFNSTRLAA